MSEQFGTITCGAFSAAMVGYNRWEFTCSWLPEFRQQGECTRATASRMVIQLQAKNRQKESA